MARRTQRKKAKSQKKQRKQRKRSTRRRYRGGDYRIATIASMEGVPLSSGAGVSIAGRSGIFSREEAEVYKQLKMNGDHS
jgi:hypothetical protein